MANSILFLRNVISVPKVWSTGGNVSQGRVYVQGAGTLLSGLIAAGSTTSFLPQNNRANSTEKYNGTTWSTASNVNVPAYLCCLFGPSENDALKCGGDSASSNKKTETYNGVSWTTKGDLVTTWGRHCGAGQTTAGFITANTIPAFSLSTLHYDGTNWSSGGDLTHYMGFYAIACGTLNDAICYSQTAATTFEYNGSVWGSGGDQLVSKNFGDASGNASSAIQCGGKVVESNTKTCATYNGSIWIAIDDMPQNKYAYGCVGGSYENGAYAATGIPDSGNNSTLTTFNYS